MYLNPHQQPVAGSQSVGMIKKQAADEQRLVEKKHCFNYLLVFSLGSRSSLILLIPHPFFHQQYPLREGLQQANDLTLLAQSVFYQVIDSIQYSQGSQCDQRYLLLLFLFCFQFHVCIQCITKSCSIPDLFSHLPQTQCTAMNNTCNTCGRQELTLGTNRECPYSKGLAFIIIRW